MLSSLRRGRVEQVKSELHTHGARPLQAFEVLETGASGTPKKRLARIAVSLFRAGLGLLPSAGAAPDQGVRVVAPRGGLTVHLQMTTSASQSASDSGQLPPVQGLLRGLARLAVKEDAGAEQALAEALSAGVLGANAE